MDIINQDRYNKHLKARGTGTHSIVYELLLPILLFGSIGAITWAIRGTSGWGGVDGTVVPGLMWGVLWYYLAYRKGLDARGIVLWLGLGIALGGELGYGQYTGWILGNFSVGDETIAIEPWIGYLWFALCGIGWAAPGGILLGWALGGSASTGSWAIRSIMLAVLLTLLFAWPFIDWLSEYLVQLDSGLLFPNADQGIYLSELGKHLSRTIYTNTQNFAVVVWWVGALLVAAFQRDKTTLVTGLIIGGGFGLGFMQSAVWCLGYGFASTFIDWWKMWELNAGFNLGLLYAVTLYWVIQHRDKEKIADSTATSKKEKRTTAIEWCNTLFLAFGGFVLLFFVGFEYFFWTGLALCLFYFVVMSLTTIGDLDSDLIAERRKNVSVIYSFFFLVFIMFHGGSERLGIIFGLYSENAVSQYSWPFERIILFVPVALVIVSVTIFKMWQALRPESKQDNKRDVISKQSDRIVDLMTVTGFIGVLSIWPAKISVFYALFLVFAIFAFNRLERRFNIVDK